MIENWVIGVIFALTATFAANIGIQVQKLAHTRIAVWKTAQELEDSVVPCRYPHENYLFHPLWICGLLIQGSGTILDCLALNYAPQSIIGPVGAVTLVINMALTRIIQRDRVSTATIIITLCITIGAVLSIVFAPKPSSEDMTVEVIIGMYRTWHFLLYGLGTLLLLGILWTACRMYRDHNEALFRFCFPAFVGIVGGQNALFAKGATKSIVLSFSNSNLGQRICLQYWEWYLMLLSVLCLVVLYVRWFNAGLKQFSPLHFYAIVSAFWILSVIVGGLVVFREIDEFDGGLSTVMFAVGSITCVICMFALSRMDPPKKKSASSPSGAVNAQLSLEQVVV